MTGYCLFISNLTSLHALIVLFNHIGIPKFRSFRFIPSRILALLLTTVVLLDRSIFLHLNWLRLWLGVHIKLLVKVLFTKLLKLKTISIIFEHSLVFATLLVLLLNVDTKVHFKTLVKYFVDWLSFDWMSVRTRMLTFLVLLICRELFSSKLIKLPAL